jgi:hypothetical protein
MVRIAQVEDAVAKEHKAADSLLDKVRKLEERATRLLDKAETSGDTRSALAAIGQLRGVLELLGRVLGELKDGQGMTANVNVLHVELTPEEVRHEARLALRLVPRESVSPGRDEPTEKRVRQEEDE